MSNAAEDRTPGESAGESSGASVSAELEEALSHGTDTMEFGPDTNTTPDVGYDAIEAYETQIAGLKDQLIRALAETENVRKRGQRDVEETNKYAITGFARNMVSVLENMLRATASISQELRNSNEQVNNLYMGVEMIQKELMAAFEKYGIRRIEPMGEKFDHNLHQAVVQIESPDKEPGTILQVMQAGYVIHDRLLQPAMVGVAKKTDAAPKLNTEA